MSRGLGDVYKRQVMRDSESFPRNGIAVRDSLGRERVFGIAISGEDGSLLLSEVER